MWTYKVVQLRNGASFYLCLDPTLEYAIEKCVDMGFFCKVIKSLGFF